MLSTRRVRNAGTRNPDTSTAFAKSRLDTSGSTREDVGLIRRAALAFLQLRVQVPELRLLGNPTFLFSFTSDAFDIYHVNDFMRARGWRLRRKLLFPMTSKHG